VSNTRRIRSVSEVLEAVDVVLVGGVEHEHVESAERTPRLGDDVGGEGLVAQVAGEAHCPCGRPLADEFERGLRVLLLLGQVRDRDIGALAREGDRDGSTDAGVAARDQRLRRPSSRPLPT
jgi:hypothetical protein